MGREVEGEINDLLSVVFKEPEKASELERIKLQ